MKKNPILYHLFMGQFDKLKTWLAECEGTLFVALDENLILIGEWYAARNSLDAYSCQTGFASTNITIASAEALEWNCIDWSKIAHDT